MTDGLREGLREGILVGRKLGDMVGSREDIHVGKEDGCDGT